MFVSRMKKSMSVCHTGDMCNSAEVGKCVKETYVFEKETNVYAKVTSVCDKETYAHEQAMHVYEKRHYEIVDEPTL